MSSVNSNEQFIHLLNTTFYPPTEFSILNIELGTPAPIEDAAGIRNTQISISAQAGRGYRGQVDVRYRRLVVDELMTSPVFRSLTGFTEQGIIEAINTAFNLYLTQDDFEPFSVPDLVQGQTEVLTLTVKPDSIGWVGSVAITLEHSRTHLTSVIATRLLPLYTHPSDPLKGQSARMLTWGIDFSSIQQAIKPTYKGEYTDWAALQSACAHLGIPGWERGPITDHATSEVADANPAFERVVIQPNVVSQSMVGSLYFHYTP